MYFEGCLGFNVIQQSGLMSRVFVGSLPITLDYRPNAFIRLDLWVLIWTWIIGYLPPLTSDTCNVPTCFHAGARAAEVMGEYTEPPLWSRRATPIKMNLSPLPKQESFWFPLIMKWLNILCVFLSCTLAEPPCSRALPPALRWGSSIRAGPKRSMLIRGKIFLLQR